jgi:probable biosynthetic protein (TIGR04098 family)
MNFIKNYKVNMPQLSWGGLSENWLLKEFGDVHWEQISLGLNTESSKLQDDYGDRLYASFVRLSWTGVSLKQFKENEKIEMSSNLYRYKNKMFFSETVCSGIAGEIKAKLMSVFSKVVSSENNSLVKGAFKNESKMQNVKLSQQLPGFAKEYLDKRAFLFRKKNGKDISLSEIPKYKRLYKIDALDDINGVGLLYFASYPKISDKCEREFITTNFDLDEDWLSISSTVHRDVFYFANANPYDELVYVLNGFRITGSAMELSSSLFRSSDGELIAQIYTIKQFKNNFKLQEKTCFSSNPFFSYSTEENLLEKIIFEEILKGLYRNMKMEVLSNVASISYNKTFNLYVCWLLIK